MVKANAYGIGLEQAAPALWAAGARAFFVAHLGEGVAARRLLPDEAEIYVLNGLETDADPADYAAHRLKPVDRERGRARALVGLRASARRGSVPARCISTPA